MATYTVSVSVQGTPVTFTQQVEAPDIQAALEAVKDPILRMAEITAAALGGVLPTQAPAEPAPPAAPA